MVKKTKSHISNRLLYTLITIGILVILGVGVYAYTNPTTKVGHDYSELQPCGANQILKTNTAGTAWTCVAAETGTSSSLWTTLTSTNWTYFGGNSGGPAEFLKTTTPGTAFTNGIAMAWNPTGGWGESVIAWGITNGYRPTLDFDSWNATSRQLSPVMSLRDGAVHATSFCLGGYYGNDCKTNWESVEDKSYVAPPGINNYLQQTSPGDIGISSDTLTVAANHFTWTTVRHPTRGYSEEYAIYTAGFTGNTVSQIYEERIPLDPNRAVVGIRLDGSYVDDAGVCIAGVPGYFFVASYHWSYGYFGTGFDDDNLFQLGLDGSFKHIWSGNTFSGTLEASAQNLKTWSWVLDTLPAGDFKLVDRDCDFGGCTAAGGTDDVVAYTKAAGITHIPPGNTLVVKGQYANAGGVSALRCKVSVIYASEISSIPISGSYNSTMACSDAGGTLVDSICRFNNWVCPVGWVSNGWSTTVSSTCVQLFGCSGDSTIPIDPSTAESCTTGSHTWSNTMNLESCYYVEANSDCYQDGTCYCEVGGQPCSGYRSQIGCTKVA